MSMSTPPSSTTIQAALKYLEGFVDRKRNIFEPSVSAKKTYKNILMLAYYRNNLIHIFINEAFVSCSLLGMGTVIDKAQGYSIDEVYEKSIFLANLLSEEFMYRNLMKNRDDFDKVIDLMSKRGFIDFDPNTKMIKIN
jgi:glycerol-3-phosphate O-acyltransferase